MYSVFISLVCYVNVTKNKEGVNIKIISECGNLQQNQFLIIVHCTFSMRDQEHVSYASKNINS